MRWLDKGAVPYGPPFAGSAFDRRDLTSAVPIRPHGAAVDRDLLAGGGLAPLTRRRDTVRPRDPDLTLEPSGLAVPTGT